MLMRLKRGMGLLLALLMLGCVSCAQAEQPAVPADPDPLDTIGIYAWTYDSARGKFWKACGINTVQLCDLGWYRAEGPLLDAYIEDVRSQIIQAQADGFAVNVLLMSNIEQWRGPGDFEPTGNGVCFDPGDEEKMADRLACLQRNIAAWNMANGFSLIAADPGGIFEEDWTGGTQTFVDMGKAVQKLVKQHAPRASFSLNTWAIAYFDYHFSDFADLYTGEEYWHQMDLMTQEVIEQIRGTDIGLEFTGQTWYQRVTLDALLKKPDETYQALEKHPSQQDLVSFEGRTNRQLIAWPYFFLDLITPSMQSNVRYIHRYVQDMRSLGVDGIIGDYSDAGYLFHTLNTYAFGRFCQDRNATPEQVIAEYAAFNATPETADTLAQVLMFLENQSLYESTIPASAKIERFATSVRFNKEALALLEQVEWLEAAQAPFDLPEAPYRFYLRLRSHFSD